MRSVLRTANKLDSVWTLVLTLPALFMVLNAGIAMHQGTISPAAFADTTKAAVTETVTGFTDKYVPLVKTTGNAMVAGTTKLASAGSSCASKSGGPIFIKAAYNPDSLCSSFTDNFGKGFAARQNTPHPYARY